MLEQLYVDNYRTFVGFRFAPPRFSVIVAENGAGKTALWEVLCGLQDILVQGASVGDVFPTTTLTRWDNDLQQLGYRAGRMLIDRIEKNVAQSALKLKGQLYPAGTTVPERGEKHA